MCFLICNSSTTKNNVTDMQTANKVKLVFCATSETAYPVILYCESERRSDMLARIIIAGRSASLSLLDFFRDFIDFY